MISTSNRASEESEEGVSSAPPQRQSLISRLLRPDNSAHSLEKQHQQKLPQQFKLQQQHQSQLHRQQVQLERELPERISLLAFTGEFAEGEKQASVEVYREEEVSDKEDTFSTPPSTIAPFDSHYTFAISTEATGNPHQPQAQSTSGLTNPAKPRFYISSTPHGTHPQHPEHPSHHLHLAQELHMHLPTRNLSTPSFGASLLHGAGQAGNEATPLHPYAAQRNPGVSPLAMGLAAQKLGAVSGSNIMTKNGAVGAVLPAPAGTVPLPLQFSHYVPTAVGATGGGATPLVGSRLALSMMGATTATAAMAVPGAQPAMPVQAAIGAGVGSALVNHHGASSPTSSIGGAYNKLEGALKLKLRGGFEPHHLEPLSRHKGELSVHEKYGYDLSRAQLKASSRTSALLAGFAMVALVELQYDASTPKPLLILLGIVTTLLVSVHLLALMMSTCLLPSIEANGCTRDSPHIKLKFYIKLSWLFSTCIGLLLFLLEIGVIFVVKFMAVGYISASYITTGMLVPVLIIFVIISYLIHSSVFTHSIDRVTNKVEDLHKFLEETATPPGASNSIHRNMVGMGLQPLNVV